VDLQEFRATGWDGLSRYAARVIAGLSVPDGGHYLMMGIAGGEATKQIKPVRNLAWGDYILRDQGQNTELAGSRWILMEVVSRVLPRFFEQLSDRVYPTFARLAKDRPGYWEPGWTFETWQLQSDSNQQLTPVLLGWARRFHAEETWILEGALQTLWLWSQDLELLKLLYIGGFRSSCCVNTLSSEAERQFTFTHDGWDPQFQTLASFRGLFKKQVQSDLDAYVQRLSSLMESQGAVRARKRYRVAHFEWFALYQLGGVSSNLILGQGSSQSGDESTILKGVKAAAGMLQWKNVRKARKARTRCTP
jgi:hypothetical protein